MAAAGKSSLVIRFTLDQFLDGFGPFIEDTYRKWCTIDNESAVLEVYDPTGHLDSFDMGASYVLPTEGFLLVYSINSRESFEEITTWYQHILRYKDKGCFSIILIANKCDLGPEREVGIHEGRDLAHHLGCAFIETSASIPINVDEAFQNLAREIREREKRQEARRSPLPSGGRVVPGPNKRSGRRRGGCVIL